MAAPLLFQVVTMSSSPKEDHLMLRPHSTRLAAALFALALGPVSVFAQTNEAVGVVTMLAGQATVSRIGLTEPASVKFRDPVFTRDRISTGEKSIVRVLLGGKAVVTARELSVLTINEESLRSTVILDSGKVGASVLKDRMKPGETIEFRTPNAVAVVRGTVLVVEVTEGPVPTSGGPAPITTTVSVIRGAVDVFALKGGTLTPVRVGGQESVRVTGNRLGTLRALTTQESRAITADLEVAPEHQHRTKSLPLEVQRAIGASEQAKAAALVDALAPAAAKGNDKKVEATLADTGAITRDAVDGVTEKVKGVVGAVDNVLLEASNPVVGLGSKVVGTTGGVVTSTTDAVVGQGNGGSRNNSGGGVSTAATGAGGGGVGSIVTTGGGLTGGGGGLTGGGLTGAVSGVTGTVGGVASGGNGAANGLVNGVANGLLRR
jgi:hypothetical protein